VKPPPPPGSNEVCFDDIFPIFRSSCAKSSCHDAATAQKGYVFDSYENIVRKDIKPGDAAGSKVYKMIIETDFDKRMPKLPYPALLASQIQMIEKWINQGARYTTNCSNACDTTQFTYTAVKKIIDANCINCHSGSTPSGGLNYSSYAGLKAVADAGRLLGAITHSTGYTPMPFQQPKLIDCKITQVRKWIQSGAPNN
jgi:mono/diheme cytochrome c family protein